MTKQWPTWWFFRLAEAEEIWEMLRISNCEMLTSYEIVNANTPNPKGKPPRRGRSFSALLSVLIALAAAVPAWAANDPKDKQSQNADDADVSKSTGRAGLSIAIEVPKGTGGSEPALALNYSSVLADGPFGAGWRLELGEIQRSARFGTPAFDDSASSEDQFEFDGVLLVEHPDQANHPGEYRTIQESFARITRTVSGGEDSWVVEFPNGRKARFGTNQETRVRKGGSTDPQNDTGAVGRWLLSELEDANGNITRFSYDRSIDVGTAYPKTISYTYRGTSSTPVGGTDRRIEFDLGDRDDPTFGYPAGLETQVSKRVEEIRSVIEPAGRSPEVYRRLALSYAGISQYTSTGRTRLDTVQLFGTDCLFGQPTTSCQGLPPKKFTYTDTTPAVPDAPEAQWEDYDWGGGSSLHFVSPSGADRGVRIGDINGDGYPDYVEAKQRADGTSVFDVRLNDGTGWGSASVVWEDALTSLTVSAHEINEILDGDSGKKVICSTDAPTPVSKNVFFSVADPYKVGRRIVPKIEAKLMDLNADGFADIILSYEMGAGSVSANTTCPVAPGSWEGAPQVTYVWINRGKAEPDGPNDPDFGWEQRDDWSHDAQGQPVLPPFYSIYLWSDAGTNSSDRPGWVLPPGDNRVDLDANSDKRGTAAYYFDHGVRMPDLNGDGRPDIVAKRGPASFGMGAPVVSFPEGVWLSRADGVGWDHYPGSTSPYLPPDPIIVEFGHSYDNPKFVMDADTGVRFADVNGDGLADIVKTDAVEAPPEWHSNFKHQPFPTAMLQRGVWLNTGDGWCGPGDCVAAQDYLPPVPPDETEERYAGRFTEVYQARSSLTRHGLHVRTKDYPGIRGTELRFVDLNGDGLIDLLKTDEPVFGGLNAWVHDPSQLSIWRQDQRFVPNDVMRTIRKQKETGASHGYTTWDSGVRIFDFDGDATVDLLRDMHEATRQMYISKTAYIDLLEEFDNGQGGLQQYAYGSAIAQRDSALEADAESDADNLGEAGAIGLPRWTARAVVNAQTKTDTLVGGSTHTTTLKYAVPRWDPETRTQLGFRAVEVANDDGSKNRTFFWQQLGRAGQTSRVMNLDALGAVVSQKIATWEVIPGSEGEGSIADVYIGRVTEEETANFYGSAGNETAGAAQTTTYTYTDSGGIPYGYNFVHQIEVSRARGILTSERIPEPAVTLPNFWMIGRLDKEIHRDEYGDVLAEMDFDYSGTLPIRVRKTVQKRHESSPLVYADWVYDYDEYGNLTIATDPEGRTTFLCYDGDTEFTGSGAVCPDEMSTGSHTVLVGVRDALGEITSVVRDMGSGTTTEVKRLYSGDSESIDLDPFGRPERLWAKPSTHDEAKLLLEQIYVDDTVTAGRPYVERWDYFRESTAPDLTAAVRTAEYTDGFGRQIMIVAPPAPGHTNPFGRAITDRDFAGRPLRGTHALACTDPDCTTLPTDAGTAADTRTYDQLGRVLTSRTPDGVTALDYRRADLQLPVGPGSGTTVSLDAVLVKDPKGNLIEHLLDGNRLVLARECENVITDPLQTDLSGVQCANPDSTFYTYEATGENTRVYDAIANDPSNPDYTSPARFMQYYYDTLGRPWKVEDPDGGTTETTFDLAGNILETLDARGKLVQYEYDALNRVESIDTPGGVGDWDLLEIQYDTASRLRSSVTATGTTAGYSESWEYDDFGNLSTHIRTVVDRTLRTDFDYDLMGRLTMQQSPVHNYHGVSYTYDGAYLTKVCSRLWAETSCEVVSRLYYVDDVTYDALGRVTTISNPDPIGDLTYDYYDVNDSSSGRIVNNLKSMALDASGVSQLDLAYTYDLNGNISHIEDGRDPDIFDATADYFYDQRNRLSSWMDGSGTPNHFAYDKIGNLVGRNLPTAPSNPGEWNQAYDPSNKPHAIRMNWKDRAYQYDAAGNVVQRDNQHLTYNSLGQLHCVGESQGSCAGGFFWYDVDGNLMTKTVGATTEIRLGSYFRLDKNANIAWIYTSAFGKRIVMERRLSASLRYAWAPATWPLPISRDLFFQLLFGAGFLGVLVLLAWLGAFEAIAKRPVTASVALGLTVLIAAPPQAWAMGGGGTKYVRYLYHDHLGTEILALNGSGWVKERRLFEPFGEVIASQIDTLASAPAAFTGKEYHDELGLYNFGARWYDAEAGRFVSVDPVVQSMGDPQTHNPYGYVRNNPLVNADPDGRFFFIGFIVAAAIQAAASAAATAITTAAVQSAVAQAIAAVVQVAVNIGGQVAAQAAANALEPSPSSTPSATPTPQPNRNIGAGGNSANSGGSGGSSTANDWGGQLPERAARLLANSEFRTQLRATKEYLSGRVTRLARNPDDNFGAVDPDKLVHRGGIIRERKKIWPFFSESNTSFYRRPQGDEGEHVARGKERYLGTAVAIRNAAAVVLVYPWNGKPRFDTIKTTFSQLDELTPVFVYHGGTTYLIEGEFGPQEIEVPAN